MNKLKIIFQRKNTLEKKLIKNYNSKLVTMKFIQEMTWSGLSSNGPTELGSGEGLWNKCPIQDKSRQVEIPKSRNWRIAQLACDHPIRSARINQTKNEWETQSYLSDSFANHFRNPSEPFYPADNQLMRIIFRLKNVLALS